jgi:hypothetical protein
MSSQKWQQAKGERHNWDDPVAESVKGFFLDALNVLHEIEIVRYYKTHNYHARNLKTQSLYRSHGEILRWPQAEHAQRDMDTLLKHWGFRRIGAWEEAAIAA